MGRAGSNRRLCRLDDGRLTNPQAAKVAQHQLINSSLEKRNEIIMNIRKKMLLHSEDLATRALEETGLGRKEDKIIKNNLQIGKSFNLI